MCLMYLTVQLKTIDGGAYSHYLADDSLTIGECFIKRYTESIYKHEQWYKWHRDLVCYVEYWEVLMY